MTAVPLLVIAATVFFAAVAVVNRIRPHVATREHLPPFVYPGKESDLTIVVPSNDELAVRQVLSEFAGAYNAIDFLNTGIALGKDGRQIVIRFPRGLQAQHFVYLINFLHYPFSGLALAGSYGVASVDEELSTLALSTSLGRAVVFIPEDDDQKDAVWFLSSAGEAWIYPFRGGEGVRRDPQRDRAYSNYWLPTPTLG